MRILLDECINHRLRKYLPGHDCQSARYAGFGGLTNGDLLDAAEAAKFEILLTVDRGIAYDQNMSGRKIAIIVFRTRSIALKNLIRLVPACLQHLETIATGEVIVIPD